MKKSPKDVRRKMIVVRMNEAELSRLEKLQKHTTEKSLSNYLRKVALQHPLVLNYRNSSLDDFLHLMTGLIKEFNNTSQNYNRALEQLYLLEKIPEFRLWIEQQDSYQETFLKQVENIQLRLHQIYQLWLPKSPSPSAS